MQIHRDAQTGLRIPALAAAISRDRLFDVFLNFLRPLGETVHVILESSHAHQGSGHADWLREEIDSPVLASCFCDFEELLLDDGCTGVAVTASEELVEVQFDEHKLLIVYARDLSPFERILDQAGVPRDDRLHLVTEDHHIHQTRPEFRVAFEHMAYRLGVGTAEMINW